MLDQKLENFSKKIKSEFLPNYNLKKLNWFNIGGKAKFFFKAENLNELIKFLKEFGNETNILVLGAGSNVLLNDRLFDGVVIKLGKNFSNISLLPNNIIVMARTSQLSETLSKGLEGIRIKYSNNLPSNITSIKNFNKGDGEDLNFLTYGSSAKNLYLILLEDL